jgi:TorA maturation chaperone TorD
MAPILDSLCSELGSERALKGAREFSRAVTSLPPAEEDGVLELRRQFTRLFRIGKEAVSLNESVHRSATRLLKQEPWAQVRTYYLSAGFQVSADLNELEDHAAVELAFMHCLTEKALSAPDSGQKGDSRQVWLEKQRNFLDIHLNAWFLDVLDEVGERAEKTNASFYLGLSLIAKEFLQLDAQLLAAWTSKDAHSPSGES